MRAKVVKNRFLLATLFCKTFRNCKNIGVIMFEDILKNVRQSKPLCHCITNYVTVNDCANIALACGGTPAMSDYVQDAVDLAKVASAVVLNIGTINQMSKEAMIECAKVANEKRTPVIFDPVAAGATKFRDETAEEILNLKPTVVRGNISEIKALFGMNGQTVGVDANLLDLVSEQNLAESVKFAKSFAKKFSTVVAISGEIDIVADENLAYIIRNGHSDMAQITGSGCMSTVVVGAFVGANKTEVLKATACSVCAMGICGEIAHEKCELENAGLGSFRTYLIDAMSLLTDEKLERDAKYEIR